MLRRIALTLVPSVALFTVAALLPSALTTRAQAKAARTLDKTSTPAPQFAKRSGYIVASS